MKKEEKIYEDQVEGRNSVLELLESKKDINKIFVTKGEKHGSINKIIAIAKERRIIIVEKDRRQMEQIAQTNNYQGVIAIVPPFEYCEIEDILEEAKSRNEDPFVLILDGIEDPHNLGSIIRTAETAGVHGIIIPKRRAASVNATVNKTSAGAVEHMKIARVTNISDSIQKLNELPIIDDVGMRYISKEVDEISASIMQLLQQAGDIMEGIKRTVDNISLECEGSAEFKNGFAGLNNAFQFVIGNVETQFTELMKADREIMEKAEKENSAKN